MDIAPTKVCDVSFLCIVDVACILNQKIKHIMPIVNQIKNQLLFIYFCL